MVWQRVDEINVMVYHGEFMISLCYIRNTDDHELN